MTTLRYFTDSLEELENTEHDLEENGIPRSHIHVLSRDEGLLIRKDMPVYSDFSKRDILHGGLIGAAVGSVLAAALFVAGYIYGVSDPSIWLVMVFVGLTITGFCTWEGGLFGLSKVNHNLARYEAEVNRGSHLMVVDAKSVEEERTAKFVISAHPLFRSADKERLRA